MDVKPFAAPRVKIARAEQHTEELRAEIESYLGRKPMVAAISISEQRVYALTVLWREEMPLMLAAIAGDAIHNLRGALDIMANDVVALGGAVPDGVYFPFARSAEDLEEMIRRRFRRASDDAKELIRALQPYPGGNAMLRALHDLDIQDKHLGIIRAQADATLDLPMTIQAGLPALDEVRAGLKPIKKLGPFINRWSGFDPGFRELGGTENGHVEITISPDLPLGGEPIIETLHAFTDMVTDVVDQFEALMLRPD